MRSIIGAFLLLSLMSCEKEAKFSMPKYIAPVENVGTQVKADKTVAQDGSGDYKTLQEAIDGAPNNGTTGATLQTKPPLFLQNIKALARVTKPVRDKPGLNS